MPLSFNTRVKKTAIGKIEFQNSIKGQLLVFMVVYQTYPCCTDHIDIEYVTKNKK